MSSAADLTDLYASWYVAYDMIQLKQVTIWYTSTQYWSIWSDRMQLSTGTIGFRSDLPVSRVIDLTYINASQFWPLRNPTCPTRWKWIDCLGLARSVEKYWALRESARENLFPDVSLAAECASVNFVTGVKCICGVVTGLYFNTASFACTVVVLSSELPAEILLSPV